jgi:hypothetical protein
LFHATTMINANQIKLQSVEICFLPTTHTMILRFIVIAVVAACVTNGVLRICAGMLKDEQEVVRGNLSDDGGHFEGEFRLRDELQVVVLNEILQNIANTDQIDGQLKSARTNKSR